MNVSNINLHFAWQSAYLILHVRLSKYILRLRLTIGTILMEVTINSPVELCLHAIVYNFPVMVANHLRKIPVKIQIGICENVLGVAQQVVVGIDHQ